MIVGVQQIEPGLDILTRLAKRAYFSRKKPNRFSVAGRASFIVIVGPLFNFPRGMLVLGILIDPFQNLSIAFASFYLSKQSFRVQAKEFKQVLIQRTTVVILSVFVGNGRASF